MDVLTVLIMRLRMLQQDVSVMRHYGRTMQLRPLVNSYVTRFSVPTVRDLRKMNVLLAFPMR
jgi:hypothetical protein